MYFSCICGQMNVILRVLVLVTESTMKAICISSMVLILCAAREAKDAMWPQFFTCVTSELGVWSLQRRSSSTSRCKRRNVSTVTSISTMSPIRAEEATIQQKLRSLSGMSECVSVHVRVCMPACVFVGAASVGNSKYTKQVWPTCQHYPFRAWIIYFFPWSRFFEEMFRIKKTY